MVLSMLAFGTYLIYALSYGLDFNQRFLGVVQGSVGKALWPLLIFLEVQLVIAFVAQRLFQEPKLVPGRFVFIAWGAIGLLATIGSGSLGVDYIIGLYIWGSSLAYGIAMPYGR
jgi:hypothetical protein